MTSSFSPYVRLWQRAFTPNKKHRICFLHQGKREKHSGTPPCSQLPWSCMRCGAFWSALVARAGPRWFMVQPDVVRSFINTQTANQQAPLPHTARSRPSDYQNNAANISVFNIPSLSLPAGVAQQSAKFSHTHRPELLMHAGRKESVYRVFLPAGELHRKRCTWRGNICVWMLVQPWRSNAFFSHTPKQEQKQNTKTKFYKNECSMSQYFLYNGKQISKIGFKIF